MGKFFFLIRMELLASGPMDGWLVLVVLGGFGGVVAFFWWLGKQRPRR